MRPTLGRLAAELSLALVAIFVLAFAASGVAVAGPCDVGDVDVAHAIAIALSSTA
jgi:hypothetical protein